MLTLAEYSHLVSELEEGYPPPGLDSKEGVDRLIVEICAAPWNSAVDREKGQWLVARLFRVRFGLAKKARNEPKRSPAAPHVQSPERRGLPDRLTRRTCPLDRQEPTL
jgi:hypothetical protein